MFTPSVFYAVTYRPPPDLPLTVCVIWRRVHGCWHFFCRAPFEDAERIVEHDCTEMGLLYDDYKWRRG